jgi:hypothetical protein
MSTFKFILGMALVLGMYAIGVTAASAHEYRVEGAGITGPVSQSWLDLVHVAVLKATPYGVATDVECHHQHGLFVLLPNGTTEGTIKFSNCTIVKPAHCGLASWLGSFFGSLLSAAIPFFKPKETSFATITLEGAECSLKGKPFELTGTQECSLPEAESEKTEHSLDCTAAGSNLKAGGKVATYEDTSSGAHIVNEAGEATKQLYSSI